MATDENQFFREMTLRICSSLDIDQALAQAFNFLASHIPVDAMGLGFAELTATRIRVLAKVATDETHYVWQGGAEEIPLSSEVAAALQTAAAEEPAVKIINRPEDFDGAMWLEVFPGLKSRSALFMDLGLHREDIGVLLLSSDGLDRYTQRHADLICTVREPFTIAMSNARRYRELARMKDLLAEDNRALTADIKRAIGVEVVGADFGLRDVMEQVRQVAPSTSPTLLLGETGTGKEVIANAIHMASRRSRGPMISMQCGAIPETLLDSELFGHEKGAFTGASERKRGRFERAHDGTLFLDEIGELSLEAQVKLLRVLQERRFERVGGTETIDVDVRVIAATHRDLERMVREGTFREDLWYRLNVLPIRIPPLRLRREDIPSLVQHFVDRKSQEMNLLRIPRIASNDLERLKQYDWPGNVRELQNIVERALILSHGNSLRFPDLTPGHRDPSGPAPNRAHMPLRTMDEAIAEHIRAVLEHVGWQIAGSGGAAELLQMNPSTLRFRMKKLGIHPDRARRSPSGGSKAW